MQIDWITGIIESPLELFPEYEWKRNALVHEDGTVEVFQPNAKQVYDNRPSSSTSFRVATPSAGQLMLSGNPIKLLQDHNLWGSLDPLGCFLHAGTFVREHAGLFPSPNTWESCGFGAPRYTRLDITRSYRFASEQDAIDYMRYIVSTARSRSGSAKMHDTETGYFNKTSQLWALKIYRKHPEFLNSRKKDKSYYNPAFNRKHVEWSEGVVRFELVLRSKEIKRKYAHLDLNDKTNLRQIWQEKFDSIQFNENTNMQTQSHIEEYKLTNNQVTIVQLWRTGFDHRTRMTKPTFYRNRKAIMEITGIDIATPPQPTEVPKYVSSQLDPAGWDPEPLEGGLIEPDNQLKMLYPIDNKLTQAMIKTEQQP